MEDTRPQSPTIPGPQRQRPSLSSGMKRSQAFLTTSSRRGDDLEGPEPGAELGAETSEPLGAGLLLESLDPQGPQFQFLLELLLQNPSVAGYKLKTLVPSVGESHKHHGSNS